MPSEGLAHAMVKDRERIHCVGGLESLLGHHGQEKNTRDGWGENLSLNYSWLPATKKSYIWKGEQESSCQNRTAGTNLYSHIGNPQIDKIVSTVIFLTLALSSEMEQVQIWPEREGGLQLPCWASSPLLGDVLRGWAFALACARAWIWFLAEERMGRRHISVSGNVQEETPSQNLQTL